MMTLKSAVLFIGAFTLSTAFSAQLNNDLSTSYQAEGLSSFRLKSINDLLVKLDGHLPPSYLGPCTPYPMCVIYPDSTTPSPDSDKKRQQGNK